MSLAVAAATICLAAPGSAVAADCNKTFVGFAPLTQMGNGRHQGYPGGLYPGARNVRPAGHEEAGQLLADRVVPRAPSGGPEPAGRYAFLSIGMSNATEEFQAFKAIADAAPSKDPKLTIVDGAQNGVVASRWADPGDIAWSVVDSRLVAAGVTPWQVSVVWVKLANANPTQGFPAAAQILEDDWATVMQNLHDRFPNLRLAYLSSRTYGGYASSTLNPEPYAYEGGFAVKWLIGDQIAGSGQLNFDPAEGIVRAPWLSWGPYLWADGIVARADGLTWACSDFGQDGTHPSASGELKVANLLLEFLKTDSTAKLWFRRPVASARSISLKLRRHLVAKGRVGTRGFIGCRIGAPVMIQRLRSGRWRTRKTVRSKRNGRYRAELRQAPNDAGRYRAILKPARVGARKDESCRAGRSAVKRHRH